MSVTVPAPGLYLGDGVAWLENLPDDYLDGIFTDPPWGSGADIHGQDAWLDGMRIADPFAGTDTTGYQARRLGLECWSWEIDPEKYRLALERHKQLDLFVEG